LNNTDNKIKGKNDLHHLKRLFNVKQASHYLGVSAGAIYKYVEWEMIAFRRLPSIPTHKNTSVKTHGRIVFELEDLDNFVEQFSEKHGPA
jgi:hypothetical protein